MEDEATHSAALTDSAGPVTSRPQGNPDLSMPGDSPLADAPMPAAPALEPDSTEPATAPVNEDSADVLDDEPAEGAGEAIPPQPEAPLPPPGPRRLSRAERESYDRLRLRFAACGRCGYFLTDLQLLLGLEAVQAAALEAHDGWLRLEGNEALRPLLVNAYGVRLDLSYDYLDGSCPECRRRFVYQVDDSRTRLKVHA